MVQKIKNRITHDKTIQVVGVQFGRETRYYVLRLDNTNNELFVTEKSGGLSFEGLQSKLDKKYPVILVFSGKGVLNKKVKRTPDYKSKVLLNVNTSEFYFYEYQQKTEVFISVARKSIVNDELELFANNKFLIVDYSIGVFSSVLLKSFVNKEVLTSDNVVLTFTGNELDSFSKSTEEEMELIGEQQLSAHEIPLFATGLNYYYPNEKLVYDADFLTINKEEKNFKKYFELFGGVILGSFFLLLLLSYLLLGYYNDKTVEANTSLDMLQDTYSKVKVLEKERDDKKAILNESGVFTSSFLSYYINELTTDLPKTISLSEFLLFPNTKKIKQTEKVIFKTNIITIKGVSSSNTMFNKWIKGLRKIKWITKAEIIKYKENRQNQHDFGIKIIIR
ncbi:MAG: hypothetical protein COA88_09245 [Kordia sp.]|nr:MAG: hypothetical protein COA88_09245 [Kordia sp.]